MLGWDVGPGEDGDMTLRLRKAGYRIIFAPYAQCYTNLLTSFTRLLRQRRRWDWAVVTFECRKHVDLGNICSPNFRFSNLFMLIERWLFNIGLQYFFWAYVVWCLFHLHEHTAKQFFLYYLVYMGLEVIQLGVVLSYSNNRKRDLAIGLVAPLMPLYYLAMKLIGRGIRPLSTDWVNAWSKMYAFAEENLGMLAAIKAFTRETFETGRFARKNETLRRLSTRQLRIQSALTSSVAFLATAGLLLLVWLGARQMQQGTLDAAELVSLLLYAMLMTRPISGLAGVYGEVQRTRGAAERLLDCFARRPEPDSTSQRGLASAGGAIVFEDVSFAYAGRAPAVRDIRLEIAAGETVGIIGPNGAGKSTLAWLLMRFAEPDRGRILIDDMDISGVSLHSLRGQIGLVPQHTLLLNASVAENIAYGLPGAEMSAIRAAAVAARADEFIRALPEAYDTLIGDQGVRLSGGQRQRISLARTLLKDPPIIVLDEATSMFDPQGEKDFLAECADILAGKTVLMITHRPVALSIADRVVELHDGQIAY